LDLEPTGNDDFQPEYFDSQLRMTTSIACPLEGKIVDVAFPVGSKKSASINAFRCLDKELCNWRLSYGRYYSAVTQTDARYS
jgi:hypothetical protein